MGLGNEEGSGMLPALFAPSFVTFAVVWAMLLLSPCEMEVCVQTSQMEVPVNICPPLVQRLPNGRWHDAPSFADPNDSFHHAISDQGLGQAMPPLKSPWATAQFSHRS